MHAHELLTQGAQQCIDHRTNLNFFVFLIGVLTILNKVCLFIDLAGNGVKFADVFKLLQKESVDTLIII